MRLLILIPAIVTLTLIGTIDINGQTINSVEIYPENPTSADSIFLIASVTTANYSFFLGKA